jgi:hypothetical protein
MKTIIIKITAVGNPYIGMALELMEQIYFDNDTSELQIKFYVFTDQPKRFTDEWSTRHKVIEYNQFKGIQNSSERFSQMLSIPEGLGDYIAWIDADMKATPKFKIRDIINKCPEDQFVIPTLHPGYYKKHPHKYPYDLRLEEFRFTKTTPYYYFCGGLQFYRNNEKGREFLQLLKNTTEKYKERGYTPLWNDESIFNALIPDVKYYLDPSYCMPDDRFEKVHLYQNILHLEQKLIALTK